MRKKSRIAELDITSLIDVLFMLIIFFVLTASFVSTSLNIDLPKSYSSSSPSSEASNIITLDKTGAILWNSQKVTKAEAAKMASEESENGILLVADKNLPYGKIVELLSLLQKNCHTSVGLVTSYSEEL